MIWGTRSRMHHPSWFQFPSWCRLIFFFWHLVFFTFPSSNTFSWDHSLRFDYLSDWLWTSFSSSLTDPVSSFLASSFFVLFRPWKWPQESGKQLLNCVVVFGHKHYFVAAFHCYFRETRNRISSHATHKAIQEKKPLNSCKEGNQEFTSLTTFVFQTYRDSPVYLDGQQEIIERERHPSWNYCLRRFLLLVGNDHKKRKRSTHFKLFQFLWLSGCHLHESP